MALAVLFAAQQHAQIVALDTLCLVVVALVVVANLIIAVGVHSMNALHVQVVILYGETIVELLVKLNLAVVVCHANLV